MADDKNISSFPSFLATKEEKAEDEYGLRYARAIWSEYTKNSTLFNTRRQRDIMNRKYAEGLESIQKYKDRLDLNGDTSYLNLDFSPVNRIATIVDNIVGRMMNQNYKIQCNAIDPESKTEFDKHRDKLYADMFLKEFSESMEKTTGISMVDKSRNIPETDEEAELDLKLKYKPAASIAMEKALQFVFQNNDSEEIRRKILRDLVVIKRAATYRYYDENKNIRYDYVDPVDVITPYSKYEDFKNIQYVGVLKQYTINELAQMNPKFTDEQLFEIAKTQAGKNNNPLWSWSLSYEGYYNNTGLTASRPYYNFNITVMEFFFLTINRDVSTKKVNPKGGFFFDKKADNYTNEVSPDVIVLVESDTMWKVKGEELEVGKGVAKTSDDARKYFAKLKTDKRSAAIEVISKQHQYRYEGVWVPGTSYLFNYKMSENIERDNATGSYSPKAELPICIVAPGIYDMENKSLVERMIPHEDQINLINLKTQQLLIKAKPPGVAIDLEGMDAIVSGMGNPNNSKMDGIEITKMYEQTGSYTFRSRDKNGNPINGRVIEPLQNGIGRDFAVLFQAYNQELQKMNDVIGYNSAVDASSPDSEALVGLQKMAAQASNNALRPLYQFANNLIVRQAKRIALMVQDSIVYNNKAFMDAIGSYSTDTITYGKKIAYNQFAINIELLPDEEEKLQLENLIGLGINQGILMPSDVVRVRQVLKEDVKSAAQLMVLFEERNRKNAQAAKTADIQNNGQVQMQSAQAASQAQAQLDQAITANKIAVINAQAEIDMKKIEFEYSLQMQLQSLKNQGADTVAYINTGGRKDVQEAANQGKVAAQHVANEGKVADRHLVNLSEEIKQGKNHGHELEKEKMKSAMGTPAML